MQSRRAFIGACAVGVVTGTSGCLRSVIPFGSGPDQTVRAENERDVDTEYSLRVRRRPPEANVPRHGLNEDGSGSLSDDKMQSLFAHSPVVETASGEITGGGSVEPYRVDRPGHYLFTFASFGNECLTIRTYESERQGDGTVGPDVFYYIEVDGIDCPGAPDAA